jgi:hypothetical protein
MKPWKKLNEVIKVTPVKLSKKFYQRWDEVNRKFERSEIPVSGFSPRWAIECEDCLIQLSSDQLGQMLVGIFDAGEESIYGYTFEVRNNGKAGKDVRYYFNLIKHTPTQSTASNSESLDTMPW